MWSRNGCNGICCSVKGLCDFLPGPSATGNRDNPESFPEENIASQIPYREAVDPAVLSDYIGNYGPVRVIIENNHLFLITASGVKKKLVAIEKDDFKVVEFCYHDHDGGRDPVQKRQLP